LEAAEGHARQTVKTDVPRYIIAKLGLDQRADSLTGLCLLVPSFLPRDAMLPRYRPWACVRPSVCLCLSQVGVLLKRLNVGSHKQHLTIAQGL